VITAYRPRVRHADTRIRRPMEIFQFDRREKNVTSGTDTGLIALAVEGAPLDLFEPEIPAG